MKVESSKWIALVVLLLVSVGQADSNEQQIKLKNAWFEVTIDAARGGRISSLVFLDDSSQWILPGNNGLFLDHVTQQDWPGELLSREYSCRIETNNKEYTAVRLGTVIDGNGDESISGVTIEKVIRIYKNKPLIEAVYSLKNPTNTGKRPGLWIQNIISPGGRNAGKATYRPTSQGVLRGVYDPNSKFDEAVDFRFDPTAGWLAVLDEQTRRGLVYYMDYNWLKCLYCNLGANTQEWWYDPVSLPPGKSFETNVKVWPIRGLDSVQYADEEIVASTKLSRKDKSVNASFSVVNGPQTVASADVSMSLEKYPDREVVASVRRKLAPDNNSVPVVSVSCEGISQRQDMLVDVKVATPNSSKEFSVFDSGVAILLTETSWRVPRPRKKRNIFKPEQIIKKRNDRIQVLHLKGLFTYANRWEEVVSHLGGEIRTGSYARETYGAAVSYFPRNYDELMAYDVIVVDNVPADGIDDDMIEFLNDFVNNGGMILVHGGDTLLIADERFPQQLLPIPLSSLYESRSFDKPILLDSSNPSAGHFEYGLNVKAVPEGARALVESNGYPVIVFQKIGKGIAAVFCPMNVGQLKGDEAFWNAPGYPAWMAKNVRKLLAETEACGEE